MHLILTEEKEGGLNAEYWPQKPGYQFPRLDRMRDV